LRFSPSGGRAADDHDGQIPVCERQGRLTQSMGQDGSTAPPRPGACAYLPALAGRKRQALHRCAGADPRNHGRRSRVYSGGAVGMGL